ncbi:BPI/LBP/CETP family protein [Handroanthus impetiginosus]|uniref:BPI/LBP/CETP family protein n=1 Tax=Handroanthus impetiginosus TaxID=429701 RepID=A0A2G9GXR9_9LAMI|nr:BPI/LBP/CETP family protein [Handroanthus impetiginosus]
MASSIFPSAVLFLLTFSYIHVQSHEEGYIAAEISNKGLEFLKDLLIEKAESSLVPLELPRIEKSIKIPVIGSVQIVLSKITVERIHVTSSTMKTGDNGIVIDVSGATANLTMNWKYSYRTWLLPISVSDKGNATIQVEGMEVGLTLSLKTTEGSLKLSLLECGCYVNDISIKLNGGASWLYQGLLDAFEGKIGSAVEDAVPKKIKDAIVKLDALLQSLPKEVPVTNIAALNVTFVNDPELTESSLDLEIDGLFSAKHQSALSSHYNRLLQDSSSCKEADKMVKISLHEDVLKSASSVYFEARKMQWIVDKVPDQSLLNTAGWRFIIPKLYKMYPNHDMNLNLSVSSLPVIKVGKQQIKAKVPLDVVIDVLDVEEVIPVACISTVISTSLSAEISGNALTGSVKLNDLTVSLKWSKIGDLHMHLIQTVLSTTLRTLVLPYINLKLSRGFHIPDFHGYELQDAQILCTDSWIVICSNVASVNQLSLI